MLYFYSMDVRDESGKVIYVGDGSFQTEKLQTNADYDTAKANIIAALKVKMRNMNIFPPSSTAAYHITALNPL